MAGNGFLYSVNLSSVTVPNAAVNLYEFIAASSVSLLLHSIRLEFVPTVGSGVAQDLRFAIALQTMTTTGTGGTPVIPVAEHPRNTVAAQTVVNTLVTTPGAMGIVKSASNPSVLVPFRDCIWWRTRPHLHHVVGSLF